MHTKILRGLGIRYAPTFDQPYSLKLELSGKLPSLHDTPPVPSKHLTRCLRNRVQASTTCFDLAPPPYTFFHTNVAILFSSPKISFIAIVRFATSLSSILTKIIPLY